MDTPIPFNPEEEFNIGETVRLKSGGPFMTIASNLIWDTIENYYSVHCQWFFKGELKTYIFPLKALTRNIEE